jgi:hypothetical protein
MNFAIFEPTPPQLASKLEPFIMEDETVLELGAGDGKFAQALAQYAKQVIAVESDIFYASQSLDIPTIKTLFGDIQGVNLHQAQVLYFFLSFCGAYNITQLIKNSNWHGTVISRYYPLHDDPTNYWIPDRIVHADLPFLIYTL